METTKLWGIHRLRNDLLFQYDVLMNSFAQTFRSIRWFVSRWQEAALVCVSSVGQMFLSMPIVSLASLKSGHFSKSASPGLYLFKEYPKEVV